MSVLPVVLTLYLQASSCCSAPSRLGRGTAVLAAPETLLRHHRPRGTAFSQLLLFAPKSGLTPPHGQAKYQDPRSTLRYHNAEVYEVLRTFQPAVIQAYLAMRGQGVVLR